MKRLLSADELVSEIAETLREGSGEFIEGIANQVLVPEITYLEDSLFEQVIDDELPVDSDGCLIRNDGDAETDMEGEKKEETDFIMSQIEKNKAIK